MNRQKLRSWDWLKISEFGDFKKTDDVLETGALFGLYSTELARFVSTIVVTDSYDWAKRRFVERDGGNMVREWEDEVKSVKNIVIEKADMQDLPYKDGVFDKVVCISAIEHVPNDRKAITEMMRVLKPNGLLLLTTEYNDFNPRKVNDPDGSFYRIYDGKSINRITKGYKIIHSEVASEFPKDYTTILLVLSA